jgi:hypothetical protein
MGAWSVFVATCATLPYDPNDTDRRAADDPAPSYARHDIAAR